MKKTKILCIILALILAFSTWVPALATTPALTSPQSANAAAATGPITLTIKNVLPKATTVTLTGSKTYNYYIQPGATIVKTIDRGKYKFSYAGCFGKLQKGSLKVTGSTATLKVKPCKMATWYWTNPIGGMTVTMRLKGWVNYTMTVAPGQTVKVQWVAGTYAVSYNHCGQNKTATIKVQGTKRWIFYPCK